MSNLTLKDDEFLLLTCDRYLLYIHKKQQYILYLGFVLISKIFQSIPLLYIPIQIKITGTYFTHSF